MTAQEVRLCGLLLQEHFGEVVEKVGTHLLRNGAQTLRAVVHETGLSHDLVPVAPLTSYYFYVPDNRLLSVCFLFFCFWLI